MQPPYVLGRAFPAKGRKKRLTKSKGFHLEHLRRHVFGYFCLIDFSQGAQWKKTLPLLFPLTISLLRLIYFPLVIILSALSVVSILMSETAHSPLKIRKQAELLVVPTFDTKVIVPTFDTKVTEYLCSGWGFFFFRQISTF